jgi:outer membrane autotransporter protein
MLTGTSQVGVSFHASSTIAGGAGGTSGYAAGQDGARGGGGGIGVYSATGATIYNEGGTINGGNGGYGGDGGPGAHGKSGGHGGGGHDGVYVSGSGAALYNHGTITGGNGGSGGNGSRGGQGYQGGHGGNGGSAYGAGVKLSGDGATLTNYGTITGGGGGKGGYGNGGEGYGGCGCGYYGPGVATAGNGGNGGNGGYGVYLSGSGATLHNHGTITGGSGGSGGGSGYGGDGGYGAGDPGIRGSDGAAALVNGTVVNSGAIIGGRTGGGGGSQADAITFAGVNNRLELWQGSDIQGTVNANDSANDTLALGGEEDGAFDVGQVGDADQYQGFEHFDKAGASTWTVTGAASFSGNATVSAGMLLVQGSLGAASTTVADGGTLGGVGSLISNVTIASGGTVAPNGGNGGAGTLTVDGDVSFASGSALKASPLGGLAVTGGVAVSDGAVVQVTNDAFDADDIGATHTVLTANGGVTGAFRVAHSFDFIEPFLDYQASSVTLTLSRNNTTFASVGATDNQAAAGAGIESLGFGNSIHDLIVGLGEEEARRLFDLHSGEIYASTTTVLIEDSRLVSDAVTGRIRAAFGDAGAPAIPVLSYGPDGAAAGTGGDASRFTAWGSAFGSWGSTDSDGNAAGLDRSTGGFLVGGDTLVGNAWRVGLFTGYSHSSFDVDELASSGDSDNTYLGIYAGTQWGALGLRLGAAYSWNDIETSRSTGADTLDASYDAGTTQVFGELGYRIDTQAATFEPFAGLAYVGVDSDGFTEDGGAAALTVDGGSTDTTFTTLGLRASTGFLLGSVRTTAHAMAGWRHAFGDVTPTSVNAFAGGAPFTVAGVPIAEDAAVLEAGFDLDITEQATFGVSYNGQLGDQAQDHALSATLKMRF